MGIPWIYTDVLSTVLNVKTSPYLKEDQTALGMVARELAKTLSGVEQLLYGKQ